MIKRLEITASRKGLFDISADIQNIVRRHIDGSGLCTIAIQHTSASLLIQENADPTARADLQNWLERLVPEGDSIYTHTLEGADDMPAHIKSMLTQTTLSVPIENGELSLGVWQGIYLWEHRHNPSNRVLVIHLLSDS